MAIATNGDCELYYDTFGDPTDPTLLLVNGLGSQCINYRDEWCQMFAGRGFHVVRFDNRDVGLSTSFEDAPLDADGAAYRVSDMARDGLAVLDACGVERAHVMGLSMGGMIVQTMAIEHPDRLLSMTSVMSTTGEPEYGQPTRGGVGVADGAAADRSGVVRRAVGRGAARVGEPGVRRRGPLARRCRARLRPLVHPQWHDAPVPRRTCVRIACRGSCRT